ncbi:hypothetical protein [uncultured Aeromicrobium sp.]|uniref:hypothetical protein n=1 Tax=uncultured Aeromicrobium sp. TaxID=337820 RepID=UPI0025F88BCD|nr:hypothetical protein [uncultured Aeromicrobium sp.]
MSGFTVAALDLTIDDTARYDLIDEQLIVTTRGGLTLRLSAVATDRLARTLAPAEEVVVEMNRLRRENGLLRAELERAQRLIPSADLASVTEKTVAGVRAARDRHISKGA